MSTTTTRVKDPDDGGVCECSGHYWWRRYCGAYVCDRCGDHKGLARCFCGWHKGQGETPEGEDSDYFGDEPVDEEGFYRD